MIGGECGIQHVVAHLGSVEKHFIITQSADTGLRRFHRLRDHEGFPEHRAVPRGQALGWLRLAGAGEFSPGSPPVRGDDLGRTPCIRRGISPCGRLPRRIRDDVDRSTLIGHDSDCCDHAGIGRFSHRDNLQQVVSLPEFSLQVDGERFSPRIGHEGAFSKEFPVESERELLIRSERDRRRPEASRDRNRLPEIILGNVLGWLLLGFALLRILLRITPSIPDPVGPLQIKLGRRRRIRLPAAWSHGNPFGGPVLRLEQSHAPVLRHAPSRLRHLVPEVAGPDLHLPMTDLSRPQRLPSVGNLHRLIRCHLATIPKIALILRKEFRRGGDQNLVGGLPQPPCLRRRLQLPRQPRSRDVDTLRVLKILAPELTWCRTVGGESGGA